MRLDMATGKKSGGRLAGTPNKLGASAKENIACVFVRLGGAEAMAKWAIDNQTQFYNIYAKLMPLTLDGSGENGQIAIELSQRPQLTKEEWLIAHGLGSTARHTE